tara:strand:- start:1440 stop:1796 length:357 start_codon:yes stop_codon:yes gene_type:complete
MIIEVLAWIGLIISVYALYVKLRVEHNRKFKPLCDIKKNISCTRAFTSKYGNLAILPNPLIGVIFYVLVLLLPQFLMVLSIIGLIATFYLAYLSAEQRNFCLVCLSIYLVNILIFAFG